MSGDAVAAGRNASLTADGVRKYAETPPQSAHTAPDTSLDKKKHPSGMSLSETAYAVCANTEREEKPTEKPVTAPPNTPPTSAPQSAPDENSKTGMIRARSCGR